MLRTFPTIHIYSETMANTRYELTIRAHNIPPHLDIEEDIRARKNGQITFTLRINNGNIVDYSPVEYVNARQKYLGVKSLVIQKFSISQHFGDGGARDPLWEHNF